MVDETVDEMEWVSWRFRGVKRGLIGRLRKWNDVLGARVVVGEVHNNVKTVSESGWSDDARFTLHFTEDHLDSLFSCDQRGGGREWRM